MRPKATTCGTSFQMRGFLLTCLAALAAGRPQANQASSGAYDYGVQQAAPVPNLEDTSSSPTTGLLSGLLQSQDLSAAQFVQHPQGAQSYYLPPTLQQQQPLTQVQQPHVAPLQQQQVAQLQQTQLQLQQQQFAAPATVEPIQLQIPIPNDAVQEKKIVLRLPPQQYPVQQPLFPYRVPPRKHYKIILVRAPTPAPTPPPQPAAPEVEEQTLIYVLVKKPDEPSAEQQQQQLQQIQQAQQEAVKFNKPEVYFIQYKARKEDAPNQPPAEQQQQQQQLAASADGGSGYSYDGSARAGRRLSNEPKDDEMMME